MKTTIALLLIACCSCSEPTKKSETTFRRDVTIEGIVNEHRESLDAWEEATTLLIEHQKLSAETGRLLAEGDKLLHAGKVAEFFAHKTKEREAWERETRARLAWEAAVRKATGR